MWLAVRGPHRWPKQRPVPRLQRRPSCRGRLVEAVVAHTPGASGMSCVPVVPSGPSAGGGVTVAVAAGPARRCEGGPVHPRRMQRSVELAARALCCRWQLISVMDWPHVRLCCFARIRDLEPDGSSELGV